MFGQHLNICEIQNGQLRRFWHTQTVNGTRLAHKVDYPVEALRINVLIVKRKRYRILFEANQEL